MRKFCRLTVVLLTCLGVLGTTGCSGNTSAATPDETVQATTTTVRYVSPGVWTDLSPAGDLPAPRMGFAMAYEPVGGRLILFGGWNGKQDYSDTWAYDPPTNTWASLKPAGSTPAARHGHALAYDPVGAKLILFGGTSVASKFVGLSDTWAYDPAANAWEKLSPIGGPPRGRSVHALVYDPGTQKVILFGGSAQGTYLSDTWAYDPAANTWRRSSPTGDLPPGQGAGSLVFDSSLKKLVLFGGWDGTYRADTWLYDPAAENWARVNPVGEVPAGRHSFGMAYDANVQRTILFGGWQDAALDDTWSYDARDGLWTRADPAGDTPAPRHGSALVFDPDRRVAFLFGGSDDAVLFNDTWSYNAAR